MLTRNFKYYSISLLIILFTAYVPIKAQKSISYTVKPNNQTVSHVLNKIVEAPFIKSITVGYSDKKMGEAYYQGTTVESRSNIRSITHIVVSLLIGNLLEQGYINSIEEPIAKYFPNYISPYDKLTQQITIKHLLTMSSGFLFYEGQDDNIFNYSDDWTKTILNLDFLALPGETYSYCSANYHVLSAIIKVKSGKSVEKFAKETLFKPLGIKQFDWEKDPMDINKGAEGLHLNQTNLYKIGQLIANNGKVNENQIVSEEWLKTSTTNQFWGFDSMPNGYGYGWNIDNTRQACISIGNGGQVLIVSHDKKLVVSILCNSRVSPEDHMTQLVYIIDNIVDPLINEFN